MLRVVMTALAFSTLSASAEVITTTDGRSFELLANGKYKELNQGPAAQSKLVIQTPYFEHHAGQYGQNSIRFMPIVKNETDTTVVGFRFTSVFLSAFGDEVFSFSGESSERVKPGALSTASTFFYFEDNQFIGNEPYDKLKIFKANSTGTVKTRVTAIVFEDGSLWKSE